MKPFSWSTSVLVVLCLGACALAAPSSNVRVKRADTELSDVELVGAEVSDDLFFFCYDLNLVILNDRIQSVVQLSISQLTFLGGLVEYHLKARAKFQVWMNK